MTQSGDPLENAIAERANGILKVEWLYKMRITTRDECRSVLDRIIDFYNTQRPHMSIGMQTPEAVHMQTGEQQDSEDEKVAKIAYIRLGKVAKTVVKHIA